MNIKHSTKVSYSTMTAQVIVLKAILKNVSV